MKNRLATPALIACVLFLGFLTGVGIFQHMFWIPEMFESAHALTRAMSGNAGEPQKFWIPLHGLTFLTMIASLIFNRNIKSRKRLILTAFCGYIYISLISIYFARQLFAFKNIKDISEFSQKTNQWLVLSWHRPIFMAVIELLLLIAISKSISFYKQSPSVLNQ